MILEKIEVRYLQVVVSSSTVGLDLSKINFLTVGYKMKLFKREMEIFGSSGTGHCFIISVT